MTLAKSITLLGVLATAALLAAEAGIQENGPAGSDWTYYHGDQGATRFSSLTQINTENVGTLRRAWTFHTGDSSGFFESTPIVVDSVMYFSTPTAVFALDAVAGTGIWKYETTGTARRGPSYWPGGEGVGPRVFSATSQGLVALDATTGTVIPSFGENGFIPGLRMTSPPALYRNVVVTQGARSTVEAWDAVSGEFLWSLHLKAQPEDPNRDTWLDGSAETFAGGPGLWGFFSIDAERGMLFVPVEKVGNDYWGGPHPGNNLYSDSLIAVDVLTGEMKWFQQLVHHDIWDYDPGAAPTLIEVRRDGETIPAVAMITKMGLLFVFHRDTGEPIFGMEERPVPQTTVEGEWTSRTQPFPIKPEPLARNSLNRRDLDGLDAISPELEAYCIGLWERYNLPDTVPYNPWQEGQDIVVFPGAIGGGNWNGVTFHPTLGLVITNVMNAGQWGHLVEEGGGRGGRGRGAPAGLADPSSAQEPTVRSMRKVTPEGGRFWEPESRYSCAPPPWGELVAVDANTGDIRWRIPAGEFPELAERGLHPGQPMLGGAMSTAGNLVFMGATIDGVFRAFDARSGEMLWSEQLAAPAHSIPSSYLGRDGKQYIAVPAGGGGFLRSPTSDEVIAWTLP